MPRRKRVRVIRQPSSSGSRANNRLEIISCVGSQEPYGSVERIGVPDPSCGTGVPWTKNILVPNSRWEDERDCETWASATCSRPRFDSLDGLIYEQWIYFSC